MDALLAPDWFPTPYGYVGTEEALDGFLCDLAHLFVKLWRDGRLPDLSMHPEEPSVQVQA